MNHLVGTVYASARRRVLHPHKYAYSTQDLFVQILESTNRPVPEVLATSRILYAGPPTNSLPLSILGEVFPPTWHLSRIRGNLSEVRPAICIASGCRVLQISAPTLETSPACNLNWCCASYSQIMPRGRN